MSNVSGIVKEAKFKVGDYMECVDSGTRGGGWELDLKFTIKEITYDEFSRKCIYWPAKWRCGVYENSLRLVSINKWTGGKRGTFKR